MALVPWSGPAFVTLVFFFVIGLLYFQIQTWVLLPWTSRLSLVTTDIKFMLIHVIALRLCFITVNGSLTVNRLVQRHYYYYYHHHYCHYCYRYYCDCSTLLLHLTTTTTTTTTPAAAATTTTSTTYNTTTTTTTTATTATPTPTPTPTASALPLPLCHFLCRDHYHCHCYCNNYGHYHCYHVCCCCCNGDMRGRYRHVDFGRAPPGRTVGFTFLSLVSQYGKHGN